MNDALIIFARMGSSRLPGKPLIDIEGRSLLGRVLDRSRRVRHADKVIIATSSESDDDAIANFAEFEGVAVYRGALEDVAARALACAEAFGVDRFARVCGDRPFFDPEIVDRLFKMHGKSRADLATNVAEKTFPAGATAEIITTEALRKVLSMTRSSSDREHVTSYFYSHPEQFAIVNLKSEGIDHRDVSLVVDNEDDLKRARFIARVLGDESSRAGLNVVIELARKWYLEQN